MQLEPLNQSASRDVENVKRLHEKHEQMLKELARVIVGQHKVIEQLMIALFSGGHCLLVGVPGLAKTSLVQSIAKVLALTFKRIQFTPDLMPSDITGTDILEVDSGTGERYFRFVKGPLFAQIILADEINRTPPKTQAALLEAMQEYSVTASGKKYDLEKPFFVLATQNPIEQEGTYPLPEAQLDRFMFQLNVDYPETQEEAEIVKLTTSAYFAELSTVVSGQEILDIQDLVRRVPIADEVIEYAIRLVKASRPEQEGEPSGELADYIKRYVNWGAGPRASQYLVLGGKARAILNGRYGVSHEDIQALARPVLRHRILINFRAEADGVNPERIIEQLLQQVSR